MDFDVFLSHNSKDKPAVRELKSRLEDAGLRVWYDEVQLTPGRTWQPEMEEGIRASRTFVLCADSDGSGPWQTEEVQAAMQDAVHSDRLVIPVLLPSAHVEPVLPLFVKNRTWVDLRSDEAGEAFARLVAAIAKQDIADGAVARSTTSPSQVHRGGKAAEGTGASGKSFRIFLAAPGDLADERTQVRELVESLGLDLGADITVSTARATFVASSAICCPG